ncbi:hypothetical protein OIU85_007024 [Salix viminalis]|uniref:Uncharacterized protein n=1 Tax=Salix viminalis TaxID=40686 RepID=A0A9Q0SN92_SALVM|nr:hypothetical protein OIU85_007024 [Salix viminalis]
MSDARVLAEQQIWAAVNEGAGNQAFNCTNGDVFTWKSLWKVLLRSLMLSLWAMKRMMRSLIRVAMMKGKGKVWDEIVEKYGLLGEKMEDIACFEALNVVLHLGFQHVCSMNKSRELGFLGHADTLKSSIPMWVGRMRDMKIIS